MRDKTIILGVTGGIAAYKGCELVSRLRALGVEVLVVMTPEAAKLVTPLTFRALSGRPVITDLFSEELSSLPVPHISLAKKASLIVIAPCTANIIGKIANGIADDPLTTIVMASTAKKLIAPAMNAQMWQNPLVAKNVQTLKEQGCEFIGPEEGRLACGDDDIGRMSEPEQIVEKIIQLLVPGQDLKGKRFLITAGGTREALDPVRYLSNRSSGKMGYALAEAAQKRGAEVILISCPTYLNAPAGVRLISVESAKEMHDAVMGNKGGQDAIIMAAAVADYRPKVTFWQKLKKGNEDFEIALSPTIDVVSALGKSKNGSFLVGFALETENPIENAKKKLEAKNMDLIIANDDSTFESDRATVSIIDCRGEVETLPSLSKTEVAHRILDAVLRLPVR